MTPTKEEWKQIEEMLERIYHQVELAIDGYHVRFYLARVTAYKNKIIVRVNSQENPLAYVESDCEERRRFACPSVRYLYPKKARDEEKRIRGRLKKQIMRELKAKGIDIHRTYTVYSPLWGSFKKLKAHLLKNNENIEWVNKPQPAEEKPDDRT